MRLKPNQNLADTRYEFAGAYLAKFGAEKPEATVFDIGTGEAPMRPAVEKARLKWVGFDLFPRAPDVRRWDFTKEAVPADGQKADLVLLLDVIEHVFDVNTAMTNIVGAMKPGSVLLMTVPNPHWSRARTLHLLTGAPACFTQHDLDVNHHVFLPLIHVMEKLVADHGLKIENYVTLDGKEAEWPKPRFSPGFVAGIFESLFRKLIEAFDKSASGKSYALVLRNAA